MLIVNSLLLALLMSLTLFNMTLFLYAEGPECEEEGVLECEYETWDYCMEFCDEGCNDVWFDWGECGCSGTCYQWWWFECKGDEYMDIYECITYGHGCWIK